MMQPCECRNCDTLQGNPLQGKLPIPQEDTENTAFAKLRLLTLGLTLTGCFALVEYTMGWWSNSLALVADSGHLLSDCLAMGLSLLATGIAQLANRHPKFLDRFLNIRQAEVIAAIANGIGLLVLAGWIAWEAIDRFQSHSAIVSEAMLITAIVGLLFNLLGVHLFHSHSHSDLNVRGAFLHILADTISSIAVIISALLILVFHWEWADACVSLFAAGLIAIGTMPFLRESWQALRRSA
ncbi:cation diffusion facilitator family transporter [Leptolyngbya ohadii]|uniref:cation diffusion facilitator family transporter n=1 Tax=Leptolyngbya ohadii TaxID=1962290 RepID=UPI000B5A0A4A|nr:cation diffusion facilitator family transporter [Leptolyngbya ohadii]